MSQPTPTPGQSAAPPRLLRARIRRAGFPTRRDCAWGALVLIALLAGGCGYHWSGDGGGFADPDYKWHGLYREDIKTVAVPIFTNKSYYRGTEFALSKAVVNQLESRTPYKVVPRERADTLLEGEIIDVRTRTLSRYPFNALPQEQLLVILVNFTWKDLRSGAILVQRHNFEQTASYYPTLGEDPFVGNQRSVELLAIAIVEQLEADWSNQKK